MWSAADQRCASVPGQDELVAGRGIGMGGRWRPLTAVICGGEADWPACPAGGAADYIVFPADGAADYIVFPADGPAEYIVVSWHSVHLWHSGCTPASCELAACHIGRLLLRGPCSFPIRLFPSVMYGESYAPLSLEPDLRDTVGRKSPGDKDIRSSWLPR